MIAWPVISRELLAESRRPFNYWVRVLCALVLLLAILVMSLNPLWLAPGRGGALFGSLNALLFLSLWIVVPLLTADCISREKREGTLGLLFLTPLKSGGIVLAKSLVHALRASSLLLVAIPVLAIPLLLGGVSGTDLLRAGLLDSSALLLALTAGLRASSLCRERTRAIALAVSLSALFALIFLETHAVVLSGSLQRLDICWRTVTGASGGWGSSPLLFPQSQIFIGGVRVPGGARVMAGPIPAGISPALLARGAVPRFAANGLQVAATVSLGCVFTLLVVLLLAARQLRRGWQEEPPSRRVQWWQSTFCTPRLWRQFFRGRMTRTLNRNPIGWLQQYSWSARLSKWGWCLGLVLYECFLVVYEMWDNFMDWQFWPALFLIASMAFAAANSFSRERQTGALELLLVTPLPVRQIMGGRLLGIWEQFLPSFAVWLAVWMTLSDPRFQAARVAYLLLFTGSFLTIAIIGLHFSLQRLHFLAAWLLTGVFGLLFPLLLTLLFFFATQNPALLGRDLALVSRTGGLTGYSYWLLAGFIGVQVLFAGLAWTFLRRNLSRRLFVLTLP